MSEENGEEETVTVWTGDGEVRVTHPDKVMFPAKGWTKMDVIQHYLGCGEGALAVVFGRPTVLKRWRRGVRGDPFFQKRAPRDPEREYATVTFPSGRTADLLVPRRLADVVWMAQLNCLDLNPWPVQAEDLDHPDELRVDLDPTPGVRFDAVARVALTCREALADSGLVGWPKTSGARGMHIHVPIEPCWTFEQVRRAAVALARELHRRLPRLVTTAWWKAQRRGVFIDYNQNARDRTVASAYSVRSTGCVAAPLQWDEVPDADPWDFPMDRFVSERYARVGDLARVPEAHPGRLDLLLELADRQELEGAGDPPLPPRFPGARPRAEPPEEGGRRSDRALEQQTRDELRRRAARLDIRGRSQMSKDELIEAIRQHLP